MVFGRLYFRMRKEYILEEKDVAFIEAVKKKNGFRSEVEALRFILKEYQNKELAVSMIEKVVRGVFAEESEKNRALLERIKWASQTAEQNSIQLLDGMNTILTVGDITDLQTCVFPEVYEHPVLKESKEKLKEKIAYFKQMKDERESKRQKGE